jgi:hypothetical protein
MEGMEEALNALDLWHPELSSRVPLNDMHAALRKP